MRVLVELTRYVGLRQTVSKDAAKKWAQRTRELVKAEKTWDQAAIFAAKELFSEFDPIRYDTQKGFKGSIEALVDAIERLE
jgi:hypothetical protein